MILSLSFFGTITSSLTFQGDSSLVDREGSSSGVKMQLIWKSIGDAIGTCDIRIHSSIGIEIQDHKIEVVAPSLELVEGLPMPDERLLSVPDRLRNRLPVTK